MAPMVSPGAATADTRGQARKAAAVQQTVSSWAVDWLLVVVSTLTIHLRGQPGQQQARPPEDGG